MSLDLEWPVLSQINEAPLRVDTKRDQLAGITYTSGSSGEPNGVEITQGAALKYDPQSYTGRVVVIEPSGKPLWLPPGFCRALSIAVERAAMQMGCARGRAEARRVAAARPRPNGRG